MSYKFYPFAANESTHDNSSTFKIYYNNEKENRNITDVSDDAGIWM